jgi:peptidyl-prolyl cis-trans isomerase A (cyclophilin A)
VIVQRSSRQWTGLALVVCALVVGASAAARAGTQVRFTTVMGNFDVQLCDEQTPLTVASFLAHVAAGNYQNTMIHRSVPGFVIQGGGYRFDGTEQTNPNSYPQVPSCPGAPIQCPVPNEPFLPAPRNVRGTLAMAKLGGDPNSATNQWFINLANNAANLDAQNGGFTVFGHVLGGGMAVPDAVAALLRCNFGGAWSEAPMRNFTVADCQDPTVPVDADNVVLISSIEVLPPGAPAADFDGDGISDGCDGCPTLPNTGSDPDMDGVDQACDTCLSRANPVFAGTLTNRTRVSGQLDDDADGRGNACDFDYNNAGVVLSASDFNDMKFSLLPTAGLMTQTTCGASAGAPPLGEGGSGASQRCGEFDHDGLGASITSADFNLARAAVAAGGLIEANFPKCAACSVGAGWSNLVGTAGARVGRPICESAVAGACVYAP